MGYIQNILPRLSVPVTYAFHYTVSSFILPQTCENERWCCCCDSTRT